ncbi:MAG: CHAT domain-containing protein [Aphanizomenon sp.]
MNEQRLQTYYQLVQQLLSCPHGQEAAILQANRELLDVDFLQVVVEVAGTFTQQGEENTANRLLGLASQLSEELDIALNGNTPEPETPLNQANFDTYLQFLSKVLQATAESEGNPQVVYPLLAANTDKLNLTFVKLLQVWATNTLEEAEPDAKQFFAVVIGNFSNLIQQFPLGNKPDNVEIAITGYEQALEVSTRTDFPVDWAMTQNNLGNAYRHRIRGDKADNLENAIAAYEQALEVSTRTDFPVENAQTLFNLGRLYQESQQFDLAYDTFKSALVTVEDIRGEIISGEESKRKQAEEWNQLFVSMVEVCLVLGKEREAISYIERSKTRNLVELIAEKVDFTPIEYSEIQNLLDEKTAIIQFYIFNACFRAFIITKNNDKPIIWKSTEEDLDQFIDWINKYLTLYYSDRKKWRNDLNDQLTELAEIFHINEIIAQVPKDIQKIIIIPHRYLHLLPFHAIPLSTNSEYLFDKYPEGVSYAPSCQLLNIAKERLSNPILQRERTRLEPLSNSLLEGERTRLSNLFAIQDPNNNLPFTNTEVETIAANFHPQQILKNNEASKANLQETTTFNNFTNSQWLHFSCHGSFDLESPLKSALQLADSEVNASLLTTYSSRYVRINEETAIDLSKCLTLADILELNLPQCYLVCLSACETGVIDVRNNSDEFIGLSSGFMKAGAVNIVSSLWTVSDVHTAILMIKLYENIANKPQDITLALNTVQEWLRKATQVEIIDWLKQKPEIKEKQKENIIKSLSKQCRPEHQPFNQPYFWAAFCAVSPVM